MYNAEITDSGTFFIVPNVAMLFVPRELNL